MGAGRAREPGKTRPGIVVSVDELNTGAQMDLVVVVPLSATMAPSALRVEIPTNAGVDRPSRAVCRAVRAVDASRLVRRLGRVPPTIMEEIEAALGLILGLSTRRT